MAGEAKNLVVTVTVAAGSTGSAQIRAAAGEQWKIQLIWLKMAAATAGSWCRLLDNSNNVIIIAATDTDPIVTWGPDSADKDLFIDDVCGFISMGYNAATVSSNLHSIYQGVKIN